MAEQDRRETELILAPNEYAFVQDKTKGQVNVHVGPHKMSLANTDQPVIYDSRDRRFKPVTLDTAIQRFVYACEGEYIVLENPASDPAASEHPTAGTSNSAARLQWGKKVNIPGPVTFPIWPGQVAKVLPGHQLRSNEYLNIRVYNEEAARKYWSEAVIKPQKGSHAPAPVEGGAEEGGTAEVSLLQEMPDLTMGKILVVKGTEVSFYIPPTGIEVVPEGSAYVRKAVTLEQLEYCVLLDENGNKRYVRGPSVVFPEPTQAFEEVDGLRKFRAIELNEVFGLYIKVIAPYRDDDGVEHKEGDELFITGREQMIYFPRPEHAIIRYGDQEDPRIQAVAIPAGHARYVLDRSTGEVRLVHGPCMYLPDPRTEVLVRRSLDDRQISLWFPFNPEARAWHQRMRALSAAHDDEAFAGPSTARAVAGKAMAPGGPALSASVTEERLVSDEFSRQSRFTPPRTITLDDRYDGAVSVDVGTGYAVKIVSPSGEREVVVGPRTVILGYDQTLEELELSTGRPKTSDHTVRTVHMRVLNNTVSDIVQAETSDLCSVTVTLSYQVNFEGDPNLWFNIENYVKFLTDRLRSMIRGAVKRVPIERFYQDSADIIRDTVLGRPAGEEPRRTGRLFPENGMRIYDVEVLDVTVEDEEIAEKLVSSRQLAIEQILDLAERERQMATTLRIEEIKRILAQATSQTSLEEKRLAGAASVEAQEVHRKSLAAEHVTHQEEMRFRQEQRSKEHVLEMEAIAARTEEAARRHEAELAEQAHLDRVHQATLERDRTRRELDIALHEKEERVGLMVIQAETEALVSKARAIQPEMIAALESFGQRDTLVKASEAVAPLSILGGTSVADVLGRLFTGTHLEAVVDRLRDGSPTSSSRTP